MNRKRELREIGGNLGLIVCGIGVAMAAVNAYIAATTGPALTVWLFIGGFLYLIGAFAGVLSFGYGAGTKAHLVVRTLRLIFAALAVFAVFKEATNPPPAHDSTSGLQGNNR